MTVDASSRFITRDRLRIHIAESGSANDPPLVFLHLWGGSSRTWAPVIEQLPGFRCLALDQRGWGRSDAPEDGYAIRDLADDAQAAIDALGLTDYMLIGHSMGAKVAQLVASRRPSGLRALALVAPAPASPLPIPDEVRQQMSAAYTSRTAVETALDQMLTHHMLGGSVREQTIEDMLAGAPPAQNAWPAHAIMEDVSADLGQIAVPVLAIAGEYDQVEPIDVIISRVAEKIAGAETITISDTGHLIPLEQPEALATAIARFWERTTRVDPSRLPTG